MNAPAIHLAFNHFPLILSIAAVIVLTLGLIRWNEAVIRAAAVLMVVAALLCIPAFRSGEPAEDLVERLDGVNAVAIHPHEEAAEKAAIVVGIEGVLALLVLIAFRNKTLPRWVPLALLVVALAAIGVLTWTSYLGGKIHHPEIAM